MFSVFKSVGRDNAKDNLTKIELSRKEQSDSEFFVPEILDGIFEKIR